MTGLAGRARRDVIGACGGVSIGYHHQRGLVSETSEKLKSFSHRSGIFVVNREDISHLLQEFLFLSFNR